jgi:hypothetical protein
MRPLFPLEELVHAKSNQKLPLECEFCSQQFYLPVKKIKQGIKRNTLKFCSQKCSHASNTKLINTSCGWCYRHIIVENKEQKKSKSGKNFCSKSCTAKYRNAHKSTGTRRSKLELWIEIQLQQLFPYLTIEYNKTDAINSELDIYIPSFKLAFELNGIFHYEPIYGQDKLASIKNNDERKFQACLERGIELVIIDTSSMTYFKPKGAEIYLSIIKQITDRKLCGARGT